VTTDWQGYVIILNPKRSEVAKRLNIEDPGAYALKVNIR
jgi:DNA-directed RNA polymerase subunit E"